MDALGIINFEDNTVSIDGLGEYRPVPAISILGRYRIIDFILSNMTNSGIDNINVFCKEKPRNLYEHLGTGTHYNINSKRGKLRILYGEKNYSSLVYNNDITNFNLNMQYIEHSSCNYVVIAPSYFIYSFDFNEMLDAHKESGADITVLYKSVTTAKVHYLGCDVLALDKEKRVTAISKNHGNYKNRNISLECYVMTKKLFMELCKKAASVSSLYWLKDVLADICDEITIKGYPIRSRVACINTLNDYCDFSMALRKPDVAGDIFREDWPVYTQTNDSAPTKFTETAEVRNSVIANGCLIEGKVENCIIGRNVHIGEGCDLLNCIILADAKIKNEATLKYVIVDKYATVEHVSDLEGDEDNPVYVKRDDRI